MPTEYDENTREQAIRSLIARLLHGDLSFFDEARVYARLTGDLALTQKELAERLGCSQSRVANKLRLLRFTEDERRAILDGGLTERHARTLLRLGEGERGERRFVLGDLRFFYNSIDRAVGMLRLAGYPAEATRSEDENGVEIRIAVTKPPRFT